MLHLLHLTLLTGSVSFDTAFVVFFSIDADPADMDSVDMGRVRGRVVSPRLCSGGVPGGVPDNETTQHIAILVCFFVNHNLMIILSSKCRVI